MKADEIELAETPESADESVTEVRGTEIGVALTALALSACGGGGSAPSPSPPVVNPPPPPPVAKAATDAEASRFLQHPANFGNG